MAMGLLLEIMWRGSAVIRDQGAISPENEQLTRQNYFRRSLGGGLSFHRVAQIGLAKLGVSEDGVGVFEGVLNLEELDLEALGELEVDLARVKAGLESVECFAQGLAFGASAKLKDGIIIFVSDGL